MMIAPAALSFFAMKASRGPAAGECPGAGRRRHAGGVDVVLDDDRNPEQWAVVAKASPQVGRECLQESRLADRDHRVELRVELVDAPEIEARQRDGTQPVRLHQLLELRDRRRVDVDAGDPGIRRGREAGLRRGAGHPEQEGQQADQNKGTPKSAAHRVTSSVDREWWASLVFPGPLRRSLSLHREGLNELCARAVAGVDVDLARLDDELAAVVVEAEVALVERERDPLASGPRSTSRARTRAAGGRAARCSPPGRGCRAGRPRHPCGCPCSSRSPRQ